MQAEAPTACSYHRVWFDPASIEDHRVHGFRDHPAEESDTSGSLELVNHAAQEPGGIRCVLVLRGFHVQAASLLDP